MLGTPVYLDLHVKIAKDWQRDPPAPKSASEAPPRGQFRLARARREGNSGWLDYAERASTGWPEYGERAILVMGGQPGMLFS